jgi:S-adenosylmethionine/arginine decarboxylase-like enzyme
MNPFGYSFLLDMYNCRQGVCDDLELHYRFLEKLVHDLDMIPMTTPYVVHAPVAWGQDRIGERLVTARYEKFPDKAGVSGWIGLVTSGIQIHSCEPKRFSTIDVYSCNVFSKDMIRQICLEHFGFEHFEEHWIERGTKYHET